MTDGSEPLRDPEELLYGFFKHMTSLSLVSFGGALTIFQMSDAEPKPFSLVMVILGRSSLRSTGSKG